MTKPDYVVKVHMTITNRLTGYEYCRESIEVVGPLGNLTFYKWGEMLWKRLVQPALSVLADVEKKT